MTAVEQYRPQAAEVAVTDPTGGRLIAWAEAARAASALGASLSKTSFAPKEFRGKPEETTAAIMLGDELGLSPLAALKAVYVIHGTPSVYARTQVALLQSHGHEVWTESSTDREVIVAGKRKGTDRVETAKWDIERARKAGYTSNSKYQTNPQEMLWAKAASEVCRKVASDVLAGVPYSVEDIELEQSEPTTTATRRRKPAEPKPAAPEPEFDEPIKATAERVATILPVDPPAQPITDAQSKKLHALLREMGINDREVGLAYIGDILGRDVDSTKTLSKAEASKAIDQMETEKEPAEPTLPDGAGPVEPRGAEQ